MIIYQGQSPYSWFRTEKLLLDLQKKQPTLRAFNATYLYFVLASDLTAEGQNKLITIIDPSLKPWHLEGREGISLFVTPRFGTISPWSSKATDILHVCGLQQVERIERGIFFEFDDPNLDQNELASLAPLLYDRMTETCSFELSCLENLFSHHSPKKTQSIPLLEQGVESLRTVNQELGLALTEKEIDYLLDRYQQLGRNPTDVELMMFAQINSEHCRHKVFNAQWNIDGSQQDLTLFGMIKNTYQTYSDGVLSAYKDNGAVIEAQASNQFFIDPMTGEYSYHLEPAHIVIKVETHNHPTAIAPFAGAATGAGGEIRDEGATGVGGRPKAGLTGFTVSNLHIPDMPQAWEQPVGYPTHIASALEIMLQGPIGSASFNNEFGRPSICGYFRTFESLTEQEGQTINIKGYHKPIMLAGGHGQIRPQAVKKNILPEGAKLIVLGGPAMLIGLGGGAASSVFSGSSQEHLDFASVQRSNPEMQRRCQEVINRCWAMGAKNPIISIHDVGAGGLSNAFPELLHDSERGGKFELHAIPTADTSLSALEIWCNEAQERYVLAVHDVDLDHFEEIARRERCPFAVVGVADSTGMLLLEEACLDQHPIDLPLDILFGEASRMHRREQRVKKANYPEVVATEPLEVLIERVLQLPVVANKSFLITIGDRTVTGLVARDQMVGPWQVPVSDVGVTASGFYDYTGEAMAIGERTPLALLDAQASARMAVGEALTNIAAADITRLSDIKLSANWMAAVNEPEQAYELFQAVKAVGMELCPELELCIPVGKDSLSMQMKWRDGEKSYNVAAPVSLVISAFAPVRDIRQTLTPQLRNDPHTELMLMDLGAGKNRLGASALAQVTSQLGLSVPDVDDPKRLKAFFDAIQQLRAENLLLAYHDRSDGGLLAAICEMSFCSHLGITLELSEHVTETLFNEELGAVIQYRLADRQRVSSILEASGLLDCAKPIGRINSDDKIIISHQDKAIFQSTRVHLQRLWSETSYRLQALRDNPQCAQQEFDTLLDSKDPGLHANLTFEVPKNFPAIVTAKPKVAILREQGVNGHSEMAAAFERVGFLPVDVHMTDIINGQVQLASFQGLVACGGFSFGDVLGAGRGWANSILFNPRARDEFSAFFASQETFVLGVCNGCQMLSNLTEIIPGSDHWPRFLRNNSEQFEARLSLVKVAASPSIFFKNMQDSVIPIVVSHGEGRAYLENKKDVEQLADSQQIALQYVNNYGEVTEQYPANPNGGPLGIAGLTNTDGRFTIMMPHPERSFRTVQFSWHPSNWQQENSPWIKMFTNAREFLK